MTLALFGLLIAVGAFVFPLRENPAFYIVYVVVLSAALVLVCWWKGEPPRWRWGRD